jgi:hypothetical protein
MRYIFRGLKAAARAASAADAFGPLGLRARCLPFETRQRRRYQSHREGLRCPSAVSAELQPTVIGFQSGL